MGQSNEVENPSLILENLQNITIEDENDTSLENSFHIIRNILSEYKLYKNIISKNQSKIDIKNSNKSNKKENKKEYSKEELINMDKNNLDKNILNEVQHKIERIKKWVKMSKYPSSDKNKKEKSEIFLQINNNTKNMNKKNKSLKKPILSKYVDYEIENGLIKFYQTKPSKFIQRIKKGPPDCFRWCSWCILNFLPLDRSNLIYENYTNMALEKENKDRIIRDIERTFPNQKISKKDLRKKETSLYKVLKAFWNLDKEIGYCQGMNLIVGFMLILSNFNERDTFYLLTSMFSNTTKIGKKYDYNIRGLFYDEFPLLSLLNYIFENLLEHYCPELKEHLESLGITIDLWMGRWFHTIFTLVLPINWCKRIWDNIFSENIFFLVKFGICFSLMIKEDILNMEEEIQVLNYFKKYEKYSLCFDNEELDKKHNINKIIEKSQKININLEFYFKIYEKLNPGFTEKLNKIDDIKYEFFNQSVRKPTQATILFSEDDNTIKRENSEDKEININVININTNKINSQNKKNKIPNLKISFSHKNEEKDKIISNGKSNNNSPLTDFKILNNINNNENNLNNLIRKNNSNNEKSNNNTKKSYDSINDEYEENIESTNKNENIIKKNINLHKFENFLNRNRLDIFSKKSKFKTFEKNEHFHFPTLKGRNETIGLHLPNENDMSSFIGINKFKIEKKLYTEKKKNKEFLIDKEKIDPWCF